jgi:serine/threonine-protein kinase RsbW
MVNIHAEVACQDVVPFNREAGQITLRSLPEIARVLERVTAAMGERMYSEDDIFAVHVALEEALINAIQHGNRDDPLRSVRVGFQVWRDSVVLEVQDEGEGFNPMEVANPLAKENLERLSGRGLLLMRHYMDWVRFNARGNLVAMCKYRDTANAAKRPEACPEPFRSVRQPIYPQPFPAASSPPPGGAAAARSLAGARRTALAPAP